MIMAVNHKTFVCDVSCSFSCEITLDFQHTLVQSEKEGNICIVSTQFSSVKYSLKGKT